MIYLLLVVGTILGYILLILPAYVYAIILLVGSLCSFIAIYIELTILEKKVRADLL
ncbi:hypothetical protein [Gottfriedia acidiceleris]|uniref:Uncharacterized protein n=1 Tax=Gottfriedia acidiceleris TaxID=371036 RepID=A0ABY4JS90_9BACI|nr:hypothetical protein [Gottfriedia acidiceleris]UPM56347.1 hypothetical protein MY490_11140 [Gottfriedia acidiceleris]